MTNPNRKESKATVDNCRHFAELGNSWHQLNESAHDSIGQAWDEPGRLRTSESRVSIACGCPRSETMTKRTRKEGKATVGNCRHFAELDNSWHSLNGGVHDSIGQAWDEPGRLRTSESRVPIACGRPRSETMTKRDVPVVMIAIAASARSHKQ